jgi:hypothetical protein
MFTDAPYHQKAFRRASVARVESIALVSAFSRSDVGRRQRTSSSKPVQIIGRLDVSPVVAG